MRITTQMMVDSMLHNVELNQQRTSQLQSQISSGTRITQPSDDPIGAARALNLQDGVAQSAQYLRNIDQATSILNTSDSALDSVTQALQRTRELAVQGANGTLSSTERAAVQAEVTQLQGHILDLSNSKFGAYYLFSGTSSGKPGFVQAAPSSTPGAYQGNDGPMMREISPGTTLSVNADARSTFDPTFQAFQTLQAGLSSGDNATLQSSLTQLDTALDAINLSRSQLGAKVNRLEFVQQRQQSVSTNLTGLLSTVKDVDMASAITNFSMAQTVYQASLKAGAQALQPSLLDYLK